MRTFVQLSLLAFFFAIVKISASSLEGGSETNILNIYEVIKTLSQNRTNNEDIFPKASHLNSGQNNLSRSEKKTSILDLEKDIKRSHSIFTMIYRNINSSSGLGYIHNMTDAIRNKKSNSNKKSINPKLRKLKLEHKSFNPSKLKTRPSKNTHHLRALPKSNMKIRETRKIFSMRNDELPKIKVSP